MNQQPHKSPSTDNFTAFRAAWSNAFVPKMDKKGTAADPFDLDLDEPGPAARSARKHVIEISSDDDDKVVSPNATRVVPPPKQSARKTTTTPSSARSSKTTPRPIRPIMPPAKSVDLAPRPKHSSRPSIPNSSRPPIKSSPHSSANKNTTLQGRPTESDVTDESSLSEAESEQNDSDADIDEEYDDDLDDDDMDVIQKMPGSPVTPSRQSLRRRNLEDSPTKSVGSSSPLLSRLREQQAKGDVASRRALRWQSLDDPPLLDSYMDEVEDADVEEETEVAKMVTILEKFYGAMKDDHGTTVRWLLHDNRVAIEDRKPLFMDKVSPFAGMGTSYYTPGSALPPGATTTKLESHIHKKAVNRRKLVTRTISDDAPKVPQYYFHTTVRRNILTANQEKLKFIPFLGDVDDSKGKKKSYNQLVTDIHNAYIAEEDKSGRNREILAQIRSYLDSWLKELDLGINYQQIARSFLDEDDKDIELDSRDRRAILSALAMVPMSRKIMQTCKRLSLAFDNVFKHTLKDVIFRDEKLKETLEQKIAKKDDVTTPSKEVQMDGIDDLITASEKRIGTYAETGCLICGAMWCQTHGDYRTNDRDDLDSVVSESGEAKAEIDDFRPVIMRYTDLLRKQDVRLAEQKPDLDLDTPKESPCSDTCYYTFDYSHMEYEVSPENLMRIRSMVISLRGKNRRPCDISFLLNLPCWQVDNEINQLEPRFVEISSPGRPRRPEWYNNKQKTLKGNWHEMSQASNHEERGQANPCAHDGPCLSSCQCFNNNILCESLCGCSDDCPRKWTGCSCHASGLLCTDSNCLCIQMNRECGTQCVSCGAIYRINPANRHQDEMFATGCQNVSLQRGVSRKVVMGESQLAGFGLYIAEPVKKGQFIIEYAGEVVSHNEAERRGIFYDRKLVSFLFDLNSEWVIDAARLGNSSRFINHAEFEKDGLNCEAKIVLVNGEHRIKFIALRDLKVGEELLFNYGKKFAEKHGLSKKLPKAKKGEGSALIEGKEALEALDGVGLARRTGRELVKATRGGARAGSGRKARKTVKTARPEVPESVEEADEPMEDDNYDDGGPGRSGKRKIRKPSRYSH